MFPLYSCTKKRGGKDCVTVHRYPVNVTAYAHLKSPAAMGHMLCPRNGTGPWLISGVISHGVNQCHLLKEQLRFRTT